MTTPSPSTDTPVEIVWFKRDLRTADHKPFALACESAQKNGHLVLPVYFIEPEIWQAPDSAWRHWHFITDSLMDLNKNLARHNLSLIIVVGSAVDTLTALNQAFSIKHVWSHMETGNAVSFARDQSVKQYLQANDIEWVEITQHAVSRGKLNRDHYGTISHDFFNAPYTSAPNFIQSDTLLPEMALDHWHTDLLNMNPFIKPDAFDTGLTLQSGGRKNGLILLDSFISNRHKKYLQFISKPLGGDLFSSRISAHLAYGTLSVREVMLSVQQAISTPPWSSGTNQNLHCLKVFQSRLFWQSHFMQKLETEPSIEFHAMHPDYHGLRKWDEQAKRHFKAWQSGHTGIPIIDACMRCLIQTGWLPFRMRALLVSFASYQLWIPWQKTAVHLAQLFTDYEPGIHYPQIQMQSGTTGINTIRIYNPIKQSKQQDSRGAFIRTWCPELANLDNEKIHTPWELDALKDDANTDITKNITNKYPDPIIDLQTETQRAKDRIYAIKKQPETKVTSKQVYLKHGSRSALRKRSQSKTPTKRPKDTQADNSQMPLF